MEIASYTQPNFSFMRLSLWGRPWRFIIVNKRSILLPVMIVLRNGSFLCLERKFVVMNMLSSLFFSLKVWESQMSSLLTFPIFFKWRQGVDCDVLRSSADSRIFSSGLYYTNSLKVSWLRSEEWPGLGSSLNDVSPEWNFETQFRTWRSVMTPWLSTQRAVSVAFLLF